MLKQGRFGKDKIKAWYRPGTTDENALIEVLDKRAYRRASAKFDVEAGEHWLDLGANIGAFALYCKSKGAKVISIEPMQDCFDILIKNTEPKRCLQTAVTNIDAPFIQFWTAKNSTDHYRGTILPRRAANAPIMVKNIYGEYLFPGEKFDGIKMDIEGAEFGLIDDWLLPKSNKLVFEYHLSRDNSLQNLAKRFRILRKHYKNVVACPELMRLVKKGTGTGRTYFDRCVYCWGLKNA